MNKGTYDGDNVCDKESAVSYDSSMSGRNLLQRALVLITLIATSGASTALAQDGRGVLLYDSTSGVGLTAQMDVQGNVVTLQPYDSLPTGWTHIVPIAYNVTVLYNKDTGAFDTAYLDPDGAFTTPIPQRPCSGAIEPGWTHIVAAGGNRIFYYRADTGRARVGFTDTKGCVNNRPDLTGFSVGWTHVIKLFSDLLFFYNANSGAGATGWINPDGSFHGLQNLVALGSWTHVVPANFDTILLYSSSGAATVAQVLLSGNFVVRHNYDSFYAGWTHIMTGTNGITVFYDGAGGTASTGSIEFGSWDFATLQVYDSLGQGWTRITVQ